MMTGSHIFFYEWLAIIQSFSPVYIIRKGPQHLTIPPITYSFPRSASYARQAVALPCRDYSTANHRRTLCSINCRFVFHLTLKLLFFFGSQLFFRHCLYFTTSFDPTQKPTRSYGRRQRAFLWTSIQGCFPCWRTFLSSCSYALCDRLPQIQQPARGNIDRGARSSLASVSVFEIRSLDLEVRRCQG